MVSDNNKQRNKAVWQQRGKEDRWLINMDVNIAGSKTIHKKGVLQMFYVEKKCIQHVCLRPQEYKQHALVRNCVCKYNLMCRPKSAGCLLNFHELSERDVCLFFSGSALLCWKPMNVSEYIMIISAHDTFLPCPALSEEQKERYQEIGHTVGVGCWKTRWMFAVTQWWKSSMFPALQLNLVLIWHLRHTAQPETLHWAILEETK